MNPNDLAQVNAELGHNAPGLVSWALGLGEPTIVTTNLPFKDWGKLFHNSAAASAIADRLVHKGLLIRITGKSRRSDQELEAA